MLQEASIKVRIMTREKQLIIKTTTNVVKLLLTLYNVALIFCSPIGSTIEEVNLNTKIVIKIFIIGASININRKNKET